MEKGVAVTVMIFLVLIILVFGAIVSLLFIYYFDSKNLESSGVSGGFSKADINYYLPSDFAAIKVKHGVYDANVSGILLSFEDLTGNSYKYQTSESISEPEATYIILKNQLAPQVPEAWNFSEVRFISLRYVMASGKFSVATSRIQIDPSQISKDFGEKCAATSEQGGEIICQ